LPGAVPPFASVLKIKGIIDAKFSVQEKMAFNAGLKSKSMIMNFKDFPLEGF
jgi:prolyl-tRNA editing enzyme YbaK/EbsC (Cys-tRNA(Pro) deacylase)